MHRMFWACAVILCGLASSANAEGMQLLDSPGLAGAIWYPCHDEPKDVPLGAAHLYR